MHKMKSKALVAVFLIVLLSTSITSKAAEKKWSLREIKGAPSSENCYSWHRELVSQSNTTELKVTSYQGDASASLFTSNGISVITSGVGRYTTEAKKGRRFLVLVRLFKNEPETVTCIINGGIKY